VPHYRVASRTLGSVDVVASNWLVALGEGLGALGIVHGLDRIACEVLPNGKILVRDVRRGQGYVVQPLEDQPPGREETEDTEQFAPSETEELPPSVPLLESITRILGAPDRRGATRSALESAMTIVGCEGGAVLLEQQDSSLLFAVAAGPDAAKLRNLVLPAGTGVAGFSVDHAVALTVNEPYDDRRFYAAVDHHTGTRTRSILVVPIAVEHKVFGCIELINSPAPGGFAREALGDVSLVADALAERLARQ
jgi:hypothetical protein